MRKGKYCLQVSYEDGPDKNILFDYRPSSAECKRVLENWVSGGDWGIEGLLVSAWYRLYDPDGEEIESDSVDVSIEPDHDALIRRAGGDVNCDHEWSTEGEGGCEECPGVWSLGGTTIMTRDHCIHCGLRREQIFYGSQRDPGQADTVEYFPPE